MFVHFHPLVAFELSSFLLIENCPSSSIDFNNMFQDAVAFTGGDLSGWADCVYNVQTTESMFQGATSFNGTVVGWELSANTDMQAMFHNCQCNPDVGEWWVGAVRNMDWSFDQSDLQADISGWDGT